MDISNEDHLYSYKKEKNYSNQKEFTPYPQSRSVNAPLPKLAERTF